jgi:hypothetical protein
MSDIDGASAPADTGSIASNEPVIAATPAPISTEPRAASPAQAEETARQAAEAKAQTADKVDPKKAAEPAAAEKAKPLSTREALRKAAEKVNAEPAKDAKAEPEKAAPLKDGPARADDGKFAAKEPVKAEVAKAEPAKAAPAADATKPIADAKTAPDAKAASEPAKDAPVVDKGTIKPPLPSYTASAPPSRFSPDAKEAWAAAPEPVRAEVARMEKELTAGFEKHRAAAERDNSIAEFHEMAAKGGTTVKEALSKYVGMENQLRADPIKGLEIICQNAGLSLREVAGHLLGQTPEQQASQTDATMRELRAEIAELKKSVGGVTQTFEQQRTQTTHESVTKFAADHPRFEELSEDIAFFLKTRTKDLAEAYSLAERLNPAPAKAQAEVPAPASSAAVAEVIKATPDLSVQTERGSKSIAGAPTAGSNPVRRQPSNSIKEAIRRAAAAAG